MATMTLPRFNMDNSETDCCPRFDPAEWDGAELEFEDRLFLRGKTLNVMHVPLNMGSMIKKTCRMIGEASAAPDDHYLILSTDPSPWRGEHYFAVTKKVPSADMVKISGRFLTKVFEGPYRDAGKWASEMKSFVASPRQAAAQALLFLHHLPQVCQTLR